MTPALAHYLVLFLVSLFLPGTLQAAPSGGLLVSASETTEEAAAHDAATQPAPRKKPERKPAPKPSTTTTSGW